MRVLVCGDRNWTDEATIRARLERLVPGTLVIHGDQFKERRHRDKTVYRIGADAIADRVARALGLPVDPHPADWDRYGLGAGPRRNREMLDLQPDLVIAFHNSLDRSKGTKDTVEEARRRRIPVEVIRRPAVAVEPEPEMVEYASAPEFDPFS